MMLTMQGAYEAIRTVVETNLTRLNKRRTCVALAGSFASAAN